VLLLAFIVILNVLLISIVVMLQCRHLCDHRYQPNGRKKLPLIRLCVACECMCECMVACVCEYMQYI